MVSRPTQTSRRFQMVLTNVCFLELVLFKVLGEIQSSQQQRCAEEKQVSVTYSNVRADDLKRPRSVLENKVSWKITTRTRKNLIFP
jgi:hypothetical protein